MHKQQHQVQQKVLACTEILALACAPESFQQQRCSSVASVSQQSSDWQPGLCGLHDCNVDERSMAADTTSFDECIPHLSRVEAVSKANAVYS